MAHPDNVRPAIVHRSTEKLPKMTPTQGCTTKLIEALFYTTGGDE